MSALQNTVCQKVRNNFSNKIEQSQKFKKILMLSKHANDCNHVFHKHGKFILIEQLNNIKNTSAEVLKQRLKDRKNYWIKWLNILTPFSLNQELN